MAKKFISVFAVVLAMLATACEKGGEINKGGDDVAITLSVSPETIQISALGEEATLEVTTDAKEWNFVNATSWLNIRRHENTLTMLASENTSDEVRKGTILIVATTGSTRVEKSVVVEQAANTTGAGGASMFECPVFEEIILSSFDFDGDGKLSAEEAARITDLTLTMSDEEEREPITSLKGIKSFVNLVNLDCDCNNITELDLSGLEKLEYVDCSYNLITTIDVSGCKSLKWLYAYSNRLNKLYVTGCDNLMFLQAYNNSLKEIDVTGFPEMIYLDLRLNDLKEAKFSNCPKLQIAAIGSNQIMSLDLTGLPELYTLGCYENSITSLDVTGLPKLEMLECYANNLATLDCSKNPELMALTCQRNLLTELNIEGCTKLKKIDCSSNYLTGELDVNGLNDLYFLHCGGNNYTSIKANTCTLMTDMECANTQITELEVSNMTLLESLIANDCQLTEMDCSNNTKLDALYLQGNPLEVLYLSEGQSVVDLKLDNHDVIQYK